MTKPTTPLPDGIQALMSRIESAMAPSYWGESHVVTIARNDLAPLVAHIQSQAERIAELEAEADTLCGVGIEETFKRQKAQARIEALEWLVEVMSFNPTMEWLIRSVGPAYYGSPQRNSEIEYSATLEAARAAVEGK